MTKLLALSFLCGVIGTFCGGLFVFLPSKNTEKLQTISLGLAGGFMIAMVLFDIIPQIVEQTNLLVGLLGMSIGILLIVLLNFEMNQPFALKLLSKGSGKSRTAEGLVLLLAIGLHNFPEGMAIGSMELVDKGLEFAILMTIHNIPEGMAVATMLNSSGWKRSKCAFLAAVSGAPTVLGAVVGHAIGAQSNFLMSVSLGVAGGAMLVIIFADILPTSFAKANKNHVATANIVGIIAAIAIIICV
ncbi:MAG: ZIP family metal transporter [Clostridia bacterium]